MKLTKKERAYFKDLNYTDSEIAYISKNVKRIKIFDDKNNRITHKKFISLDRKYSFLRLVAYSLYHGAAKRICKGGIFYFERS